MKSLMRFLLSILIAIGVLNSNVYANERWYVDATAVGAAGKYSSSILRDDFYSAGASLNIDYLDYYSFSIAYNNLKINYKDLGAGAFNINQDALAVKITTQLVAHRIINNSPAELPGNVTIVAPKLRLSGR